MGDADQQKQTRALQDIAHTLKQFVRVAESVNTNLTEVGKMIKAHLEADVDLDELLENVTKLKQIQAADREVGETIVPFEVDDIVRVSEENHAWFGREGTVIGVRKTGSIRVMFEGVEGYSIFTAEELEKVGEQVYKEA